MLKIFLQRYSDSEKQRAEGARYEQTGWAGYPGQSLPRAGGRGQLEAVRAGGECVRGPEASVEAAVELQRLRVTRQGECRDWGQVRAVIMDCTHILVSCHVMKIDWED